MRDSRNYDALKQNHSMAEAEQKPHRIISITESAQTNNVNEKPNHASESEALNENDLQEAYEKAYSAKLQKDVEGGKIDNREMIYQIRRLENGDPTAKVRAAAAYAEAQKVKEADAGQNAPQSQPELTDERQAKRARMMARLSREEGAEHDQGLERERER